MERIPATSMDAQWSKGLAQHSLVVDEITAHNKEWSSIYLGEMKALPTAIKLSRIERPTADQAFSKDELNKRNFVVCSVVDWLREKIHAVYTLKQADIFEFNRSQGCAKRVDWYHMDLPKTLQQEACNSYSLMEDSVILSYGEWQERGY